MEEQVTDFILCAVVSFFAWFFGGLDGFLIVLITLSIADWILGTLDRYTHDALDPKEFRTVVSRKIGEFCFVGIAHVIDKYMLGDTATFRTGVTFFYIIIEGKSIMEHTDNLGLPIPQLVKKRFSEFEEKLKEDEETEPEKPPDSKDDMSSIYKNIYED